MGLDAKFLTPLRVEQERPGRWRVLTPPLQYQSAILGTRIDVPCGYLTDFASVPRWPLLYWWFGNRATAPAAIHDFLTQVHITDRATADAIFYEAMEVAKDPAWAWQRKVMWAGVRVGGGWAWETGPERFFAFRNHLVCD